MTKAYSGINFFDDFILELLTKYKNNREPICVNFRDLVPQIISMDRYTHFIHPYPAKLLQQIPYFFLNNAIFSQENDTVLDAFCGTGTVLLEASIARRNTIGIDVNPLASLIAKTKTTKVDILNLKKCLANIEEEFKTSNETNSDYRVPTISNIENWYSTESIRKLSKIKYIVSQINDQLVKEFFQVVFSLCCKKFSFADPRISVPVRINIDKFPEGHSLREVAIKNLTFINENKIFQFFSDQAEKNISRVMRYQNATMLSSNQIKIYNTDINTIENDMIQDGSVQLILTSPPYVSAQKYIRASSLSLQWLELNDSTISELNKKSVGREEFPKSAYAEYYTIGFENIDTILKKIYEKNKLRACITYKYLVEMENAFKKFYNMLKKDGYFIMVIGNNTIAGYEFVTHEYLIEIAENLGFSTELVLIDDIKSRGLMTKRNKTASIISREHIVVFKKV